MVSPPTILYRFIGFRRQCLAMNILNFYHQKKCIKWIKVCPIYTSVPAYKKKEVKNKPVKQEMKAWVNMTVEELISTLDCDIDIIDIILKEYKSEKEILSQQEILKIANNLSRKLVYIKSPHIQQVVKKEKLDFQRQPPPDPKNLVRRPPIVTIMGHVDHGKTTLLDALRNTFVVDQEFGGITQHIGAFSVEAKPGKKITFIDTPGHAAFTTMRARGANVTDIVVLVVAADDGVMEQTIESIKIAIRANVKIIVAVNKIDKANPQKIENIKDQLLVEGIQVEDKGGNVQLIPISAKKKQNLDLLVEMILVEAEMMNLQGDPKGLVEGVIIESKVDKKGALATVIVKRGTLKKRAILIADKCFGKVRLMLDENGQEFKEALPSTAIQVWGWEGIPTAGENVFEVSSEKEANRIIKLRLQKAMEEKQKEDMPAIMEKQKQDREKYLDFRSKKSTLRTSKKFFTFFKEPEGVGVKEMSLDSGFPALNIILKGDVHGSLEVLLDIINSYDKEDECELNVVSSSVGDVTLSDLSTAEALNAIIYAFNVTLHPSIEEAIAKKQISIRQHNILYKMMDDLKDELSSRMPPKDVENIIGEAEVKENFFINVKNKKFACAGCICTTGELRRNCLFKIIRNGEIIHSEGKLSSMRHLKNDVNTISKNVDCGLMFETFTEEFKPADKIICYEMVQEPQKSTWDPGFNTAEK